jgi:hypothetical protein
MNRTKYVKGECQHCGGHLEFLAEHIGMTVPCPHCGQETELLLARPPEESAIPKRAIIWTGVAVVILGLGLVGAMTALQRAQKLAERQKVPSASMPVVQSPATTSPQQTQETNSPPQNELQSSDVSLEHAPGTSLVYAVGKIKNISSRQRFGVKVELGLFNAAGQETGTASDYAQVLEPGAQWKFKALVVDSKAISAKIRSIHEDQ